MSAFKSVRHLKRFLLVLSVALTLLVLAPTTAFSQTSNMAALCRQANPDSGAGLVAYFSPDDTNPIKANNDSLDGPAAGEAVYLTSSSADKSADGKFIRIWFKSIDPNYKLGWISADGEPLKMGPSSWRAENCIQ